MTNYEFLASCQTSHAWDYLRAWVFADEPAPGIYDKFGVTIRIWPTGKVEVIETQ